MPDQRPRQWTLEGYDARELDEALQANGRRRSEFATDLLPLLRNPRYLSLALKHYERLEETGDFTIDRLLYEDKKDSSDKRYLKMSDNDFRSFLAELARNYREGRVRYSRRDLEDLVPRDAAADLNEMLTDGLLIVERGLVQRSRLDG